VTDGPLRFELERAITENELVLHYQPRVLVSTLELRGVEALVRWRHPDRGIVPPAEFVAAAERSGLMHRLDAWVIREALLQAAVWRRDGLRIGMSVNVTPSLLGDESFLRLIERTLNIQGDPTTLTFEVAAAALVGTDPPLAGLARLRERGVRLALDNVTTVPLLDAGAFIKWTYVKLGRSLITGLAHDDASGALVHALVARATELGSRIVAVGVESDAAVTLLRETDAYLAQGYLIAPPLGVKELAAWSLGRERRD
jgi:EAL domain-containing protein (putative c-di-GMP-specific phosphodiesterase class I)